MKFTLSALASAFLVGSTFAQRTSIGFPFDGATVQAGTNIIVEIDRPNFLSGAEEVAVVLGLLHCPSVASCLPPEASLGTILYNGPYDPEYHSNAPPSKPPHQNFTVAIPSTFVKGTAQLAAFHVSLVGASRGPFTEINNITVNVQ
ncbi:hypothetical protein BDN70DRAFT_988428 [Pholiota conissans]|uniref:Phosphatidylglycerol/phosphatidylinositol transfer protein n=1 Tax=Pholiota conissans TaxID=109636 RepID=A0A9P5ZG27_9AGAR|nr:hypothetical protein BDN70DRAFT_988428 [Pholiota conissans]